MDTAIDIIICAVITLLTTSINPKQTRLGGFEVEIAKNTKRTIEILSVDSTAIDVNGILSIPSTVTINGRVYSVVEIGSEALLKNQKIKTVIIPNSIHHIGYKAFQGCSNLEHVSLGNNILTIAPFAFDQCIKLKEIKLPESVTIIGTSAFRGCKSLKTIILPNRLKMLHDEAFAECFGLEHIEFPSSLKSIHNRSFRNYDGSKQVVDIMFGNDFYKKHLLKLSLLEME